MTTKEEFLKAKTVTLMSLYDTKGVWADTNNDIDVQIEWLPISEQTKMSLVAWSVHANELDDLDISGTIDNPELYSVLTEKRKLLYISQLKIAALIKAELPEWDVVSYIEFEEYSNLDETVNYPFLDIPVGYTANNL